MGIDLVGVELSAVGTDELEAGICGFQARLSAATAVFVLAVAEYDRRRGWEVWECRSMAHWLAWRCGTGMVAAREQVRVGHALGVLPVIRERFCSGQLSYSQVRALTRVATPLTDRVLADLADAMTASQLEQVVRAYRRSGRVDAEAADDRMRRRRVSWHWDDDGMLIGRLCLPAEEGTLLVAAVDADVTPERVAEAGDDGAEDGWGAARADALLAMCEARLAAAGGGDEVDAGSRFVVNVLVDQATLSGKDLHDGEGTCQIEDGPGLAAATVRRLACDAPTVTTITDPEGNVLDVGRRTRRIGRRLRRALQTRDGGCRYPGCTARRTQAHHITHWADGGTTSMDNLVSLCSRHHHRHHEGGYRIERARPGKLLFVRADGRIIDDRPPAPATSRPGGGLPATDEAFHSNWDGDPLPLADILTVLHQTDRTGDPAEPERPMPQHDSAESSEAPLALADRPDPPAPTPPAEQPSGAHDDSAESPATDPGGNDGHNGPIPPRRPSARPMPTTIPRNRCAGSMRWRRLIRTGLRLRAASGRHGHVWRPGGHRWRRRPGSSIPASGPGCDRSQVDHQGRRDSAESARCNLGTSRPGQRSSRTSEVPDDGARGIRSSGSELGHR